MELWAPSIICEIIPALFLARSAYLRASLYKAIGFVRKGRGD